MSAIPDRARPLRSGDLVQIVRGPGAIGIASDVQRHESGHLFCTVVRGAWSTLYWVAEVERVGETLREHVEKLGHQRTRFIKHRPDSAGESMVEFRSQNWDDLNRRKPGGPEDLVVVAGNAQHAVDILRGTAIHLDGAGGVVLSERLSFAAVMVVAAGQTVSSALLLHVRENTWNENATLAIMRTSLEALATAAGLLVGGDDSVRGWLDGNRIGTGESLPLLRAALHAKQPEAPDPEQVYKWLSGYTHFDKEALMTNHGSAERRLDHVAAYATLSFVAWATAAMAEIVVGYDDIAEWPKHWPEGLPWVGAAVEE